MGEVVTSTYRPRILDGLLTDALAIAGAVVIEGPRASGKTETGRRAAASEIRLDTPAARQTFDASPDLVMAGAPPRLLDEWQVLPDLWNLVRHEVDDRRARGQFILTGSAVPAEDVTRHTGAGRFLRLRMRPMTLMETGHSTGTVSLWRLLGGEGLAVVDPGMTVGDIAERIVVGGWPTNLGLTPRQAVRYLSGYLDDVCHVDIQRVDDRRRDPDGVRRLISSLARNIATPAKITTLTQDANGADGTLAAETVSGYLKALARLMVTDDVPAWDPGIRSTVRLQGVPIRHLADPSLATAILGASPDRVIREINWMGLLFEALVVRDLRVYADAIEARLYHLRDDKGFEVDAIIEQPDGTWGAFEIKLGSSPAVVDAAATNLLTLRARYPTRPPGVLGVITGTGAGFVRRDGVLQIPVGVIGV